MVQRICAAGALLCAAAVAGPIIVTGTAGGVAPQVNVFDKATLSQVAFFLAYDPAFQGGVRVAVGDVNNDGFDDIVTGAGPGGTPHVKVFSGDSMSGSPPVMQSFFAFDPGFSGGVYVAAGDVNGDDVFDIIVGAGAGGVPQVRVFDGANLGILYDFAAYDPGFTGGVFVGAGDINGDGIDDIITGAGAGGGPHVKVFDGVTGGEIHSFFAFEPIFAGGVSVASADWNSDGRADIVTGTASQSGNVRVFSGVDGSLLDSFFALPSFTGGIFVAGGSILTSPATGAGPVNIFPGPGLPVAMSFFPYGPTYGEGAFIAASQPDPVPEPGAWFLLSAALGAFAIKRRC
ncbi:MAG: VCBS repeat-containing protein [Bryobacteraceae bacterium]